MSLLEAFSNIIKGKLPYPYTDENQTQGQAQPNVPQSAAPQSASVRKELKVIPKISLERVECRPNGDQIVCDCFIKNDSDVQLDLDDVNMLGRSYDLGKILMPGELQKLEIYRGPRLQNPNNVNGSLCVKRLDSDAFCADFTLTLEKQADNTYIFDDIRLLRIRDV